jgi:hypothetical protein
MTEDFLKDCPIDDNLSGRDRLHLFGARERNLGFITKAFKTAISNPGCPPRYADVPLFEGKLRDLESMLELSSASRKVFQGGRRRLQ